jgi:hypothetical protein
MQKGAQRKRKWTRIKNNKEGYRRWIDGFCNGSNRGWYEVCIDRVHAGTVHDV